MKNKKGFTLTEVLVTIAIMIILFSIAGIGISDLKKSLTQTKTEACARQIYVSAQEAITRLYTSGQDKLLSSQREFSYDPETYTGTNKLRYIYSTDENISSFCTDGGWEGSYVIEYDAYYGHVFGVFYSTEELEKYSTTKDDEQYRATTQDFFLDFADENKYNIAYYGGTELDATINDPVDPDDIIQDPEEENDKLDLTGTGFYYWEIYEDGSWGTYCVYDCSKDKTYCKDCLKDRVVVQDGYGIGVEKGCGKYLYMNRKGSNLLLSWYNDKGMSSEGPAALETSSGYIYTFPKEWYDEVEDSIVGYFYARLGFWEFDSPHPAPWDFKHPVTVFTNMRFAKNGRVVSRGADVPSVADIDIYDSILYVRSARQLYDLSLYYIKFALKTVGLPIVQETDIDYLKYNWAACSIITNTAPAQYPIGHNSFVGLDYGSCMLNYDGTNHYINGLNIKTLGVYSGLFSKLVNSSDSLTGYKRSSGTVKNLNITYMTQEKARYTGSICGYLGKNAKVSNCTTTGAYLVGYKDRKATIE